MDYNGGMDVRDETKRRRKTGTYIQTAVCIFSQKIVTLICFFLVCNCLTYLILFIVNPSLMKAAECCWKLTEYISTFLLSVNSIQQKTINSGHYILPATPSRFSLGLYQKRVLTFLRERIHQVFSFFLCAEIISELAKYTQAHLT